MSRVDIVIPPLALNSVPNYGVALLKGHLESKGHEVTVRDLDKELYVPEILEELRGRYSDRVDIESVLNMPTHHVLASLFYRHDEVREVVKLLVSQESLYEGEDLERYVDSLMTSKTVRALEGGFKRWKRDILDDGADVVALSMTWQSALPAALRLARDLKTENPAVPIVAGGFAVHDAIKGLERLPWIDYLVLGEGEIALESILRDIAGGSKPKRVIEGTPLDINETAMPDYEGFDLEKYRHLLPASFSRGCIYRCRFCVERSFWPVYRRKKPEAVVKEMENGMERFDCDQFFFSDSLVNGDVTTLKKACETIERERLDAFWGGQASTRKMTKETLGAMAGAGARVICYGIESASVTTIERMAKGTDMEFIKETLRETWAQGIWTFTYWLFGFPGERKENLEDDYRFLEENRDFIGSAIFHRFELMKHSDVQANPGRYGVRPTLDPRLERVRELLLSEPFDVSEGMTYRQSLEQEVYARNYFNPRNRLTTFPPMTRKDLDLFLAKKMAG